MKRLLSWLYGSVVRIRSRLYVSGVLSSYSLEQPVISVGNLTVGGTGKTPFVEFLARTLQDAGFQPVILTRGYGGRPNSTPLVVTDGQSILSRPNLCGDEPFLLARMLRGVPVLVGKDRVLSGRLAEERFGEVIHILDDGFQHLRLKRNFNILLVDGTDPFGGQALLPAGRLREPVSAARRADLVVITRAHLARDPDAIEGILREVHPLVPISYIYHDAVGLRDVKNGTLLPVREFLNESIVAMAAIGNPAVFLSDLAHYQMRVVENFLFRDHHRYTQKELDDALRSLKVRGARAIVTTSKDAVRLEQLNFPPEAIFALQIELRAENLDEFRRFILDEVRELAPAR